MKKLLENSKLMNINRVNYVYKGTCYEDSSLLWQIMVKRNRYISNTFNFDSSIAIKIEALAVMKTGPILYFYYTLLTI